MMDLATRFAGIEKRLEAIEAALATTSGDPADNATQHDAALDMTDAELLEHNTSNASATQLRLHAELQARGVRHKFAHAPDDYYQRDLVYRKNVLGAASVFHLCKSIVFENTKAPPEVTDCSNKLYSKYYLVITQYAFKMDTTKLDIFLHKLNGGTIPRKAFKLRVAPEKVGCTLTGFGHNAVSPVGMTTAIPIIMASTIPALTPDFFWLGGGEVHVKLGMRAAEFIPAYDVMVADIVDTSKVMSTADDD